MSIYICGDLHGDMRKLDKLQHKLKMTAEDILIVCGDFGFIWNGDYERLMIKIRRVTPATVAFVDGNHENYVLLQGLKDFPEFGGTVGYAADRIYYLRRGQLYTIGGHKFFTFGGARSIDKNYRTLGKSWWPEEEPTYDEIQLGYKVIDEHIDEIEYVITHDCPNYCFRQLYSHHSESWQEWDYKLRLYFDNMFEELFYTGASFKHWFFGHHHVDEKDLDQKWSCLYTEVAIID